MALTLDQARALFSENLSEDSLKAAVEELRRISEGQNLLARAHEERRLQGDVVQNVPFLARRADDYQVTPARVMLISNSCDIAAGNARVLSARVILAPAVRVSRWRAMLFDAGASERSVDATIASAARQEITGVFYLPNSGILEEDLLVLLDHAQSTTADVLGDDSGRLCVLTTRGHWAMVLKLSMHFCRLHEGVERAAA